MYYQNKISNVLVDASKHTSENKEIEILTENTLIKKVVKTDEWIVLILNENKSVKDVMILNDESFKSMFVPYRQILHD